MSKESDDKKTIEQVGILSKHGISLGPVLHVDSITMGLKCSTAPKAVSDNNELQTTELTCGCADKARRMFRQLQRMMERKVEVRMRKSLTRFKSLVFHTDCYTKFGNCTLVQSIYIYIYINGIYYIFTSCNNLTGKCQLIGF